MSPDFVLVAQASLTILVMFTFYIWGHKNGWKAGCLWERRLIENEKKRALLEKLYDKKKTPDPKSSVEIRRIDK